MSVIYTLKEKIEFKMIASHVTIEIHLISKCVNMRGGKANK